MKNTTNVKSTPTNPTTSRVLVYFTPVFLENISKCTDNNQIHVILLKEVFILGICFLSSTINILQS